MKTAIRKHWLDFVAIIGLIVISGAVAVFILGKQRLTLPAWVPVIGKDFFVIKADMSTAQAVTPGQGQTVNIAGVENYKEFWYTMVSLASEGQNFDGNGNYVRFQVGGGSQTVSTGKTSAGGDALFGNAVAKPIGTRPKYPGKRPPYNSSVPCYKSKIPNVNGPAGAGGPGEGTP